MGIFDINVMLKLLWNYIFFAIELDVREIIIKECFKTIVKKEWFHTQIASQVSFEFLFHLKETKNGNHRGFIMECDLHKTL